ncbi:hypothetical protein [Methylophilus luteus]|uniref:Uncharacterized protein n=1 Tax=Methylophilus luteus TaxID=640108 RepID=A0ABW3F603_9PROT
MENIELVFTALVLNLAKDIQLRETRPDVEPLALGLYIERAVKELRAWQPFVVTAVQNLPEQEFYEELPPQ